MDLKETIISKSITINAESHFWIVREFLPSMLERNTGHICTIASIAGQCGVPGMTHYNASKFAAFGFTESLRLELKKAKKNITCTTISPYYINTGMFEGVKTPLILPLLDQSATVSRIINAILQDEECVTIPWHLGILVHLMRVIFPIPALDYACWALVGYDSVLNAEFKGRTGEADSI